MSAVVKSEPRLDGFAGYTDLVIGKEDLYRPSGNVFIKFAKMAPHWVFLSDKSPVPIDHEFIAFDIERRVVKWPPGAERGAPVECIILGPHEPFPDVEEKNARTPQSEWRLDIDGNLVGPWEAQHVVYLLDIISTQRLVFPTSTGGGHAAVSQLVLRVRDRRELTGVPNLVAVVRLEDRLFSPRYGTRRPHFEPIRFHPFGSVEAPALLTNNTVIDVELPSRETTMKDKIPF
jgi:hypothetical protein